MSAAAYALLWITVALAFIVAMTDEGRVGRIVADCMTPVQWRFPIGCNPFMGLVHALWGVESTN